MVIRYYIGIYQILDIKDRKVMSHFRLGLDIFLA